MLRIINRNQIKFFAVIAVLGAFCNGLALYQGQKHGLEWLLNKANAYSFSESYETTQQGVCNNARQALDFLPGYSSVPVFGASDQKFAGSVMSRYFIPEECAYKVKDNKKTFEFKPDGSFEATGNFVIDGEKTYLLGNSTFGIFPLQKNKADTGLLTKAVLAGEDLGDFGPSVYFNDVNSRIETAPGAFVGHTIGNRIIVYQYDEGKGRYEFQASHFDFNKDNFLMLNNPSAMVIKDSWLYVADRGNRRIVKMSKTGNAINETLGEASWNWELSGIAVDSSNNIYVADKANNRLIRTKMDGTDWLDSSEDKFAYNRRLFITGEEKLEYNDISGSFVRNASFIDQGFTKHTVSASTSEGGLSYDPGTQRLSAPGFWQDTDNPLFGEASLYFDGKTRLEAPNHPSWDFEKENFSLDFYFKPATFVRSQALVSRYNSLYFGLKAVEQDVNDELSFFVRIFQKDKDYSVKLSQKMFVWENAQPNLWYHVALVKAMDSQGRPIIDVFVDGKKLDSNKIDENDETPDSMALFDLPINSENKPFVIGSFYDDDDINKNGITNRYEEYLQGNIDNLQLYKDAILWQNDFLPPYYFYEPTQMIYVLNPLNPNRTKPQDPVRITGSFLYILDSGNNRVMRARLTGEKIYSQWETFGSFGSGDFEFNNPTDIAYREEEVDGKLVGLFYIVDQGNNRIIKTDLKGLSNNYKNDYTGTFSRSVSPGVTYKEVERISGLNTTSYKEVGKILRKELYAGRKIKFDFYRSIPEWPAYQGPFNVSFFNTTLSQLKFSENNNMGSFVIDFPLRTKMDDNARLVFNQAITDLVISIETDPPKYHGIGLPNLDQAILTDVNNANIIGLPGVSGLKNPSGTLGSEALKMFFPVDVAVDSDANMTTKDKVYILEAVSDKDFNVAMDYKRAMEIYGTNQNDNLNVRLNGGLETGGLAVYFMKHKNLLWKSKGILELGVSHCKNWNDITNEEINQNINERKDIPTDELCYKNGDGGVTSTCANSCATWSASTANGTVNVGSFVEGDFTGTQNVFCKSYTSQVPPSECQGQWDWSKNWSTCEYYTPFFSAKGSCVDYADNSTSGKSCCDKRGCQDHHYEVCDDNDENCDDYYPYYYSYNCCDTWEITCQSYCVEKSSNCHVGQAINWMIMQ